MPASAWKRARQMRSLNTTRRVPDFVAALEAAAEHRRGAKGAEILGRHRQHAQPLRPARRDEVEPDLRIGVERRHVLERRRPARSAVKCTPVMAWRPTCRAHAGRNAPAVRVVVGQRREQYGLDDAEDGRGAADAERERGDDDRGIAGSASDLPDRQPEILPERVAGAQRIELIDSSRARVTLPNWRRAATRASAAGRPARM